MARSTPSRRDFLLAMAAATTGSFIAVGASSSANSALKSFDARNAMRFKDMPDTSRYGLPYVKMVYAGQLWPKNKSKAEPDIGFLKTHLLPSLRGQMLDMAIIDIEHWHLSDASTSEVDRNIDRYVAVIEAFRESLPGTRLGLYGMVPIRNYWAPVNGNRTTLSQWQRDNKRLQRLAGSVDIVFPSLYTFYDDPAGWKTYAIANIAEAHQYGHPVYGFLWPQLHKSRQPIAADFWRLQMQTLYDHCDGMVIWSPARGGQRWDADAGWWRQTVDFLQGAGLAP